MYGSKRNREFNGFARETGLYLSLANVFTGNGTVTLKRQTVSPVYVRFKRAVIYRARTYVDFSRGRKPRKHDERVRSET